MIRASSTTDNKKTVSRRRAERAVEFPGGEALSTTRRSSPPERSSSPRRYSALVDATDQWRAPSTIARGKRDCCAMKCHVYQALLIDARDRLYHVYSDGRKVRADDTNGRLLNQMVVSLDDRMSPSPADSVERSILGAFVWPDRLALSLGTTYRAADGALVRTECYTRLIDPLTGSQTILTPAPGAYPAVTMGLDGYAYAVIHSPDPHMGTASFIIAREEILTRR